MPQPQKASRRRLLFLVATAVVAGGTGIALGSTLRFQVVPVGQASLFKPQQDFPPLAKWPPQLPARLEIESFDANWEDETSPSQLVYNDRPDDDVETYGLSTDDSFEGVPTPDSPTAAPATLDSENWAQDSTDRAFDNNAVPPPISTHSEEFEHSSETVGEVWVESDTPSTIDNSAPQVNKQSEVKFSDGPVLITPEQSIPTSVEPLD